MTKYYLSSVDGDNGSDGLSWANAFATFEYAVETASAAASGPHTLLVDSAHSESLAADTTITVAGDIRILSVNRAGGDALLAGAAVGVQATPYSLLINGSFDVYMYGVTFKNGTSSTTKTMHFGYADGIHHEYEECIFWSSNTNANSLIIFGLNAGPGNAFVRLVSCEFRFTSATQSICLTAGGVELERCFINDSYTKPTYVFGANWGGHVNAVSAGCDFSWNATAVVANMANGGTAWYKLINCKIGSGVLPMVAPGTILNRGNTTVEMYNCSSGDEHYSYFHGDAFGETVAHPTIYATAGAQTNSVGVSYKVVTRASNCSFYTPYVGPWIAKPHTGTSAVTPSFEVLRDGSATAYQDDEIWGEWSYQGTSGSTQASFTNDRMTPLGTPANQATGDLAAGDWTGENATAWFGKLAPASSITPAESGFIYGRVVVGAPALTLYYDPQIRLA